MDHLWLPKGWQVVTNTTKNGAKREYYTNEATGQVYYTREAMIQYAKYARSKSRHLGTDRRLIDHFKDEYISKLIDLMAAHSVSSSCSKDEATGAPLPEEDPEKKAIMGSAGPSGNKNKGKKRSQKEIKV